MLPEGGSVNRGLLLPPLERDVSESEAEAAAQHGLRKLQDALSLHGAKEGQSCCLLVRAELL